MILRKTLLATTMIAGLMAVAPSAFAQSAPPAAPAPAPAASDKKPAEVEEVVVTGSRIKRSEFSSAAPIQVVTADQAQLRGVMDTGEMLQTASVVASTGQINSLVATGFVVTGGGGIESISLHGLGANRTLVLVNGRRAGPAGYSGTVGPFDVGVLPLTIIDRVEILKDGASSIYGSDAVAGVVNFITKKNLDGVVLDARGSMPQDRGGEEYRVSGSWGKTFDRGYLSVTADYWEQKKLAIGDRSFLSCSQSYRSDGHGNRLDVIDPTTGTFKCTQTFSNNVELNSTGQIVQRADLFPGPYPAEAQSNPARDFGFLPPGWVFTGGTDNATCDGVIDPNCARVNNRSTFAYQYQDPRYNSWSLIPATKRYTLFANGGYDLTPRVHAYGEVLWNRRDQQQDGWRQFFPVMAPSSFGPASHNPFDDFAFAISEVPSNTNTRVDYGRVVGGLKGDLDLGPLHGWSWDSFFQYSRSDATYKNDVILDDAAWALGDLGASYNNIGGPNFDGCAGVPVTPISHRHCVDINLFAPNELRGLFTPAEQAFLMDVDVGHTRYTQSTFEASATGDLFNLPAGAVSGAFGVQWRRDEINDTPGPVTLAGNLWGSTSSGITKGSDSVKEVFGELEIPLIKGMPLIDELTVNLSDRYSDYQSYGANNTYRGSVNWRITPEFRIRGTYGTSFRAPALYELFLADQTSFIGQFGNDPCYHWSTNAGLPDRVKQNCQAAGVPAGYPTGSTASITVSTGGGIGRLKAETSKAWTAGFIWTPRFADLNVALDYTNIEVANEVAQFGAANILFACYNSPTFPTDPLCSLFHRDNTPGSPTLHQVTTLADNYINIASQTQRSVDLTVRYRHELPWDTKFTMRTEVTWTLQNDSALFGQATQTTNGRLGNPDFDGNVDFTFQRHDWTVNWNIFMVGKQSDDDFTNPRSSNLLFGNPNFRKFEAEFTAFHSLSIQKDFDKSQVTLGVRNVFNETPPNLTGGTFGNALLSSQYQQGYLGRTVFLDLTRRF